MGIQLDEKPKNDKKRTEAAASPLPTWKAGAKPGSSYAEAKAAVSPSKGPTLGGHRGGGPQTPSAKPSHGVSLGAHRQPNSPVATLKGAAASGPEAASSTAEGVAPATRIAPVPQAGTLVAGGVGNDKASLDKAVGHGPKAASGPGDALEVTKKTGGGAQPQTTKKGMRFLGLINALEKSVEPTPGPKSLRPEDYASEAEWANVLVPREDPEYERMVADLRHKYRNDGTNGTINLAWEAGQNQIKMARARWEKHPERSKRAVI